MPPKRVKSKRFPSGYGWKIDVRIKGRPRVNSTFETRKIAQDVEDALRGDAARRRFNLPVDSHVTLTELIDRHIKETLARRPKAKWVENILRRFERMAGGERMVETLRRADLNNYAQARLARRPRAIKPQSVNREMVEIKSCLSHGSVYFRTLEDWQPPRAPWQPEPADGRRQTWGTEQIEQVLAQLYAPLRPREQAWQRASRMAVGDMFVVARNTGLRAGEVRRLRTGDVSLSAQTITVRSMKGVSRGKVGKIRTVPINDLALDVLKRREGLARGGWLFPNRAGTGPMSDHLKAFKTACERAGIAYGLGREGAMIFNDARRTAENEMLDAGHSPRAVGDILGHSAETMAKHYHRSTPEQRRAAVETLRKPAQNSRHFSTSNLEDTARTVETAETGRRRKAAAAD